MIDKTTFVLLIDQKSEMLYRISRTILRNDEDCKDALSETALKAWANRHKLREEALFGTWITRILINECHTIGRKKKKYLLQDEVESGQQSNAPDPALAWALESLPEKLRLPLVLHYYEGYSYEEIASMLHVTHGTVRSRLSRARNELRKNLLNDKEALLDEA